MTPAMLITLLCLADAMPQPDQSQPFGPPPVAVLPERLRMPRPKAEPINPGPPRKNYWPSPHRRFTRKHH